MMRTAPRLALITILLLGALALAGSSSFAAVEKGDWLVRVRGISLNPNDSSGGLKPDLTTGKVGVSADLVPEVDITYMLTKNLGLELIAATSKHNLEGRDGLSSLGVIAEARLLPPTLTLQYHLLPDSPFRPYAGVGINYTHIFDEDATASLEDTLGQTTVDLDDSFGIAFQAGADLDITQAWFLNLDLKYIDINTTATLRSGGTKRKVDVEIDPWVFGIGIGFKF